MMIDHEGSIARLRHSSRHVNRREYYSLRGRRRLHFEIAFVIRQIKIRQIAPARQLKSFDLVLPLDAEFAKEHGPPCFEARPEPIALVMSFNRLDVHSAPLSASSGI